MDAEFTQIDFGPLKQFLENDDVTDISYTNGGQVWLKTLSQGVFRIENTGIDNQLMEKIAFQCANSMGKSFNMANPFLDAESAELRMNFVHDSIAKNGIAVLIRKTPAKIRLQKDKIIAEQILKELNARLQFLIDVGLEYLTLARTAGTLSGGESQRIRLATQIGSGLTGVLYILDEPSIGLHQRDNEKLLNSLKKMRDLGNTLIVVEHDEDTMRAADHIVDIGPGPGVHGGQIVFSGTPEEILKDEASITGKYLSGRLKIEVPEKRRKQTRSRISLVKNTDRSRDY